MRRNNEFWFIFKKKSISLCNSYQIIFCWYLNRRKSEDNKCQCKQGILEQERQQNYYKQRRSAQPGLLFVPGNLQTLSELREYVLYFMNKRIGHSDHIIFYYLLFETMISLYITKHFFKNVYCVLIFWSNQDSLLSQVAGTTYSLSKKFRYKF